MSLRSHLQEPRLARRATIALLLAACAGPQPATRQHPSTEPAPKSPAPAASSEAPRRAVPQGWVRYVVRPGDTLGGIAACRGVRVEELAEANGIPDPRRIEAGAGLRVPPRNRCAGSPAAAAAPPPGAPAAKTVSPALERGRRLLEAARARYDAADFDGAFRGAQDAAQALDPEDGSPSANHLRARCHALAGLAAAGLEQRDRAIAEFRLAFALDPGLELAPEDASPRIQELVAAARQNRSEAAP